MSVMIGAAYTGRVVSLRGIRKTYSGNSVFEGLDLDLQAGNFYALLGKNGSGKSTLMRILAHREVATEGCGLVLGVDLEHDFCETANRIAYVSEASAVPVDVRISEMLELNAAIFRGWNGATAERLAAGFHLDLTKRAGELSRGQLVQLSLVLSLSYNPELILLDEVTSVLDASARGFLMNELAARVAAGATVLLATNIVTEVQSYAGSLVLLGNRKVKINASGKAIAAEFRKLVRLAGSDHAVFGTDTCIEVGLTEKGEPLYLMAQKDARAAGLPDSLTAPGLVSPAEIFIYLTRMRD